MGEEDDRILGGLGLCVGEGWGYDGRCCWGLVCI